VREAHRDRNNAFARRIVRVGIRHAELRYLHGSTRKYEFQMAKAAIFKWRALCEKSVKSVARSRNGDRARRPVEDEERKKRAREEAHFVISRAGAMSRSRQSNANKSHAICRGRLPFRNYRARRTLNNADIMTDAREKVGDAQRR